MIKLDRNKHILFLSNTTKQVGFTGAVETQNLIKNVRSAVRRRIYGGATHSAPCRINPFPQCIPDSIRYVSNEGVMDPHILITVFAKVMINISITVLRKMFEKNATTFVLTFLQ